MSKTVSVEQVKLAGELLLREHTARLGLEKKAQEFELEKRAAKIAFREVELGLADPFKSHDEFLNKVASLMTDDLDVIEKALERGYGSTRKDVELSDKPGKSLDPLSSWVLHGE